MTIFNSVYDTTLGSTIDTKGISSKIIDSFIKNELQKENCGVDNSLKVKPVFITGYYDSEDEIPLFTHSITINYKGTDYLCTDLRLYINTKEYRLNKDLKASIRNKTEYNFMRSKAIAELAWLNGDVNYIKDNLKFAAHVFAINISEAVARAYALDEGDRRKLNILCLVYYRSLFLEKEELSYDNKETALIHAVKVLGINERMFKEVVDSVNDMRNLGDFVDAIKVALDNPRLNNFNVIVLLTLIRNTWYGSNAKEYISASLEHVPTWLAIVYTALNEKTYKSSMVYKICEKTKKAGNLETYIKSYEDLMHRYILNASLEEQLNDLELDVLKYSCSS